MNSTLNVSMNSITHHDVHSVLPGSAYLKGIVSCM